MLWILALICGVFLLFWEDGGIIKIIGLIACVASIVFCVWGIGAYAEDSIYTHEFEITALNDNHEMYLRAHLFSSDGDTESRYYFMRPWGKGLKEGYVLASESIIIETNDETPHIEHYAINTIDAEKHPWMSFLCLLFDEGEDEYYIYVPKGSVTTDYSIGLE